MFQHGGQKGLSDSYPLIFKCLLLSILFFPAALTITAQQTTSIQPADSLIEMDTISFSDQVTIPDSTARKEEKPVLETEVNYASDDSMRISVSSQTIFLYKNATVDYQNIALKAGYIEFSLKSNTVTATGMPDSAGVMAEKPVFSQGSETFDADTLQYNFRSRKGLIKYIVTKQGEGFLHSERTKRLESGEIHVSRGKYTTCDEDHPHFYIRLSKAIAIPEKRIVSGPAYMVMEDIPLPLALPFGFFPNTNNRAAGLLIPTYGEETQRGFYLKNGGWYFTFGDHVDLTLQGTVYSRGTWGITGASVYTVRYRYNGRFSAEYFNNRVKDDPLFSPSKDFRVNWTHNQDPKANPTRQFRASVNFSSTSFEKNHSNNVSDYLTSTKQSSISYSKNWPGSPFTFTANMQQSQNSKSNQINLTLPSMAFNMNRIYPFRRKNTTGKPNWFENIQVSYSSKLENRITAPDSTFFTQRTLNNMKNGFSHTVPISLANFKVLKYINITPTVSYNGVLYSSYISKKMRTDSIFLTELVTDTIQKFTYAHAVTTSLGISVNPKIYGRFDSRRPDSYVAAVRHVMSPSASFSFAPDLSSIMPDYYRTVGYPHTIAKPFASQTYSVYENYLYGTPTINGRSGSFSFGLNNNIEMKVREKSDNTGKDKKVSILDNLNFSTAYNPFAREFNWSPVNMTGSTKLFNRKLDLRFGATFNPYAIDSVGKRMNSLLINRTGKLFRTTRGYLNVGFRLQSAAGSKMKTADSEVTEEIDPRSSDEPGLLDESLGYFADDVVNFDIPWTLNVDYDWSFSKEGIKANYTHTVRLDGDISLTPKWKVGIQTGYDLVKKEVTITNISVHRDLHCWEMRFSVVPFGERKSYSFTINARSSILRDVKYNKSKSWYDSF